MPTSHQFEVEVKTLLGDQAAADAFVAKLRSADPNLKETGRSRQLNHYFDDAGDSRRLVTGLGGALSADDLAALADIVERSASFALRTRWADGTVRLVIKAAQERGADHQHALNRLEGEYEAAVGLDELDGRIRAAGYDYLSKWSRDRVEYRYKDFTVTIDKNAGYGYVAELEKVVDDEAAAAAAKAEILAEMAALGAEELSQERVGRMFEHYNKHWPEYYRTEKTFSIE